MGWAIFFMLIMVGLLGMGADNLVNGNIGTGVGYIIIPTVFFASITTAIVVNSKKAHKTRDEIHKIEDKIEKWKGLATKAKTSEFSSKELINVMPELLEQLGCSEIEKEESDNFTFLRVADFNQGKGLIIHQNIQSLDFDTLADLMEVVESYRQKEIPVFYIFLNESTKNVYENLMLKCFGSVGAYIYNKEAFVKDIQTVTNKLQEQSDKKLKEQTPQTQTKYKKSGSNGRYQKIFPHMLSKDSDPDYLKQIDDWEWMDDDF